MVELPDDLADEAVKPLRHERGSDGPIAENDPALPQYGFDLCVELVMPIRGAQAGQRHADTVTSPGMNQ